MAKELGYCEICQNPVMDNQGRMAETYHRYIKGVKQPEVLKDWFHTYCYAFRVLNVETYYEPLVNKVEPPC